MSNITVPESFAYILAKSGVLLNIVSNSDFVVPKITKVETTKGFWNKRTIIEEKIVYDNIGYYTIPSKEEREKNPSLQFYIFVYEPDIYLYLSEVLKGFGVEFRLVIQQ